MTLTSRAFAVRSASATDLGALAEVEAAAFSDSWTAEGIAQFWMGIGARAWLAESTEGQAVGCALFREVAGEAELLRVATAPAWRRQRVARELLGVALAELDRAGIDCHLEVRADNVAAQALYAELGFVRSGQRRKYYRDDCDAWLFARHAVSSSGGGNVDGKVVGNAG